MSALEIVLLAWIGATIYLGVGFGCIVGRYGTADSFHDFEEYLSAIVWWLPDLIGGRRIEP